MDQVLVKKNVIGVDISMEETTCAVVDVRGNILARSSIPTEDYPDINRYVNALSECILKLVDENGGNESIRSVGISAPSANFMTGCIENSPNMPWKGVVPLAAMLRDCLGIAVAVANNADVIALGEHAFGSAHGMKDFIVITLGHGMGSCLFSNGRPNQGFHGFGGEVGHTCVELNGRLCGCGRKGCLEAYTAAKGIITTAREVMAESNTPSQMRQAERLTPRIIARFCDEGDTLAQEVFRRTGFMLGLGLANYASLANPEAIIITGGISKAGKWLMEPAKAAFDEFVFHCLKGKVKFLVSSLNDRERDVLGASVLAWEEKEYSLFK